MKALERTLRSRRLHREVNERIALLTERFALDATSNPPIRVFCECGTEGCMMPVEMTLSEYEAVRAGPDRWVVSSAHLDGLAGTVLAQRNGYALIHDLPSRLSTEALAPRKESTSPPTADFYKR